MVNSLYQDIHLDEAGIARVQEWLRKVDFHLPSGTPDDFIVNPHARYIGYMFQKEDLEAFAVGLKATDPANKGSNTFIRMSRGQLLGEDNASTLAVNPPVLAVDAMTMQRYWESPSGPASTGIDAFEKIAAPGELPGGNQDLDMLEKTLQDCLDYHEGKPVWGDLEILDLRVYWGTLLAGRYPRLKYFEEKGQLSPSQQERLARLEARIRENEEPLNSHGLATLTRLQSKPIVDG